MKQILIISLILLTAIHTTGQVQKVDSLVNVLNTEKLDADSKLQLYWDILLCYWNTDLDRNIHYATEAIRLAEKENNNLWASRFNRAITISYYHKRKFDLALQSGEKAIQYAIKAENKQEENAAYLELGNMYLAAGNRETALKHYINILPSLEKQEQFGQQANTLINIAIIHNQLNNNKRALHYLKQAEVIAEKHDLIRSKMFIYSSIATIYSKEQKLDSALMNTSKSYEMSKVLNDKSHIVICTQKLSGIYGDLKDLEKAKKYADECLEAADQLGDKQKLVVAWITVAKANFDMKRYMECDIYAYKAWEADSTDWQQAENASSLLCRANIFSGNPERADYFFNKYQYVRSQLGDNSLHSSLADMEVKYETQKKEIRIASLEKERQLYIWLGIIGVLLAVALGIILWQKIKNTRKEKQLIATRSVLDGEMKERARLAQDLHDRLSGNLSAVKIGLNDNKESFQSINDKLDSCIEEIRRAAHNLMPISLRFGLKTALEDFAFQFPNVHFYFFGEEQHIEKRKAFIIYCCASELVNNSQRHSGAKNINVQLVQSDKYVSLTVQDDGSGFDEKATMSGIGLKNIHDRIAFCDGKIDIITSPGKGTEITIELKTEDE